MGCDHQLRTASRCNTPEKVVYLSLQNHMEMGIGLVQQKNRTGSRVEEREQQEHLEEPTAGICDVQGSRSAARPVLADEVRVGWTVRGLYQLDVEQRADVCFEFVPSSRVLAHLEEKIAKHLAGPA